ncbi:MAG: peptidyl-prolyl cis-trans isomerase C [Psychrobacter glaciei]|jgi:peptidyl-prolyl cis-trans isomerase C
MKKLALALIALSIVGCSDSNTLATVGSHDVTKTEFDTYMASKEINNKSMSSQKAVLENYVSRLSIVKSIEKQSRLDTTKIDQQVNDYRQQLLMNAYFDQFISENVTEDAVKNYYSSNAAQYEKIKGHVAHILFRIRPGMTDQEIEVAKLKAFEASSQIKAGKEFDKIASDRSDDHISAKKGGDMGWIIKGSIDPVFSKTAFELKEGQVSEPIRTAFGFHIIKQLEAPKTVKLAFNDVKGEIRHTLKSKAKQAELDRLKSDISVEVFLDRLEK